MLRDFLTCMVSSCGLGMRKHGGSAWNLIQSPVNDDGTLTNYVTVERSLVLFRLSILLMLMAGFLKILPIHRVVFFFFGGSLLGIFEGILSAGSNAPSF